MHRPVAAIAAYFHGGTARAFRQERADSPALGDGSDCSENCFWLTEPQPELLRLRQQSFFAALHRPSQGAAGTDRVEPVKITKLRRLKNAVGIANSAQRTQSEKGFIFHALIPTIESFEQALAADRACGAAMPSAEIIFGQRLSAHGVSIVEGRLLKVACRQSA